MRFLGLASGYSFRAVIRQLFVRGDERDFLEFRRFLFRHYILDALQKKNVSAEMVGNLEKNGEEARVALYDNGRTALARAIKEAVRVKGMELSGTLDDGNVGSALADGGMSGKVRDGQPKVVVNGLTCYAVVQAVLAAGCEPVYADILVDDLNFSVEKLREILASETGVVAVVVQNNLGNLVEIKKVMEVVRGAGVFLIEDLAHSAGLIHESGVETGMTGDVVVLSFGKGKSADVCGGGAVILRNEKLCASDAGSDERMMKKGGDFKERIYPLIGWKVRNLFNLGLGKLAKKVLAGCVKVGLVQRSADGGVDLMKKMSFWQAKLLMMKVRKREFFLMRPMRKFYLVREREKVLTELERVGFYGPDFWYEKPVSPARYYEKMNFPEEKCPVAVKVAGQIINLPANLTLPEMTKFEEIIKKYEVKNEEEKH